MKVKDVHYYVVVFIGGGRIGYWDGDKKKWGKYGNATLYATAKAAHGEKKHIDEELWDNVFVGTVGIQVGCDYIDMRPI